MDASEIKIFLEGATHYFVETTGSKAEVGAPYLIDEARSVAGEFTGAIGITGRHRGTVYFTADRSLLMLLMREVGEQNMSRENMLDLVGDVANTIAGNARTHFGNDFMISVPTLIYGQEALHLPKGIKSYALPVLWKGFRASVVVVIENTD
jgi:chemotaxis protein CheX